MKIMKFNILPLGLLALATLTQACNSNQKKDTADSTMSGHTTMTHDSTAADTTDNMKNGTPVDRFLEQAAIGGLVEVEMGKIGQQKASLKSIKEFAAMIEKDHTKANSQLSALASAKAFKLPAELPALKKEHLNDLNRTSGKDFDSYYINMMVEDHINDISLFEGATKSPDTAISAFATKILPVLQKHYKQAREISMQFDQNKNKK
jgi:putative membrane protein